jgi:hypothetical protein
LVLYVYQVGWAVVTIGEPYRLFLEKADREGFQGKKKLYTEGDVCLNLERSQAGRSQAKPSGATDH